MINLTSDELIERLKTDKNSCLIDVRTDEEFEYMKDVQGKLKMARRALADTMGLKHRYRGGGGGREAISDKMRSLAQSGQLQRGQQPSDVPELRKNMPAYQPGGRFYDPDDIIHKMK